MLKIGLTGNIASGKTTVQEFLENKGFKVLCLDSVTNEIYKTSKQFNEELFKLFNTTDKKEIAKIVFNDKSLLCALESLIYPLIKEKMDEFFVINKNEKAVFVSAAMLFESGFSTFFDRVLFVSANKDIRLERLMSRDKYDKEYAKKRIEVQQSEKEKIKKSDFLIFNNGTKEEMIQNCENFIKELSLLV